MNACPLASAFSELVSDYWLYVVAGAVSLVVVAYFGLRLWLNATCPAGIQDVPTPSIDRLNTHALDHMAGKTEEEAAAAMQERQEESVPADLLSAIPPEERRDLPHDTAPQK